MDKIYYLASCDTCRKIIKALPKDNSLVFRDIKQDPVTPEELDEMRQIAGSYDALFGRKAQLYKTRGLKDQALGEDDYRRLILEHYTFLSRPVIIIGGRIFIGNSQKVINEVLAELK